MNMFSMRVAEKLGLESNEDDLVRQALASRGLSFEDYAARESGEEALVMALCHPGHDDQKVHGRPGGGVGTGKSRRSEANGPSDLGGHSALAVRKEAKNALRSEGLKQLRRYAKMEAKTHARVMKEIGADLLGENVVEQGEEWVRIDKALHGVDDESSTDDVIKALNL